MQHQRQNGAPQHEERGDKLEHVAQGNFTQAEQCAGKHVQGDSDQGQRPGQPQVGAKKEGRVAGGVLQQPIADGKECEHHGERQPEGNHNQTANAEPRREQPVDGRVVSFDKRHVLVIHQRLSDSDFRHRQVGGDALQNDPHPVLLPTEIFQGERNDDEIAADFETQGECCHHTRAHRAAGGRFLNINRRERRDRRATVNYLLRA